MFKNSPFRGRFYTNGLHFHHGPTGVKDRLATFVRIRTIWVEFWHLSAIYRIFSVNSKLILSPGKVPRHGRAWNNCNFNELKLNYYQIHIKGWIHTHYRIVSFLFIPLNPLSRTIRATERVITVLMRSQRETRSLGYPKRFVRCIGSNSIDKNEYLIQHKIRFKTKMNIFDHLMTFKTLALLW